MLVSRGFVYVSSLGAGRRTDKETGSGFLARSSGEV